MNAVHVSSEVVPFSKTGGLADVAGALPDALASDGLDVVVVSPFYPSVSEAGFAPSPVLSFPVRVGGVTSTVRLLSLSRNGVRHLFVDEPHCFDRPGLYGEAHGDFPDNPERFILFCLAALSGLARLRLRPDVIHCHDWQAALVPLFLKERFTGEPVLNGVKSVLTIHNLGYQGNFASDKFNLLEVPKRLFTPEGVEFFGSVNFLKAGIVFADKLTTVSPTYAREIQTEELGFGLDGVLRSRGQELIGILNGIDTETWNPATDRNLARTFDARSLEGKQKNKARLAAELGLSGDASPLFGCVTRLAEQKGIDKIISVIPELVSAGAGLALLGTGEAGYERQLKRLHDLHPGSVSVTVGFSEQMAHRIYAGSDFFLMPSEYEPCGLGQMISLRYGTLPIASRTGGLADSIVDLEEHPASGTGFLFARGSRQEFIAKAMRAISVYGDRETLARARNRAMTTDFSWATRCKDYVRLYEALL